MQWVFSNQAVEPWLEDFCAQQGLSQAIAPLLAQKGFSDAQTLERFLYPKLKYVEPPEAIQNLSEAVAVVDDACKQGKSIAIVSDYDVDGVTSMALFYHGFKALNFSFTHFFPDREKEGYGLTVKVVQRILDTKQHFDVLISLDCGTNSVEAVQLLNENHVQVIIVDHHQQTCSELPKAIIVNPHVHSEKHSESAKYLCTAGLAFKWLHLWLKHLKNEGYEPALNLKMKPFLDLVALGTVADIVPLKDDNRILVHFGLNQMQRTKYVGLNDLLGVSGIHKDIPIPAGAVAFQLAPRINASGRLNSADMPFRLLTTTDTAECFQLASYLNELNEERQSIEKRICEKAEAIIAQKPNQYAYVLYKPSWHIGVVGIVAGRLSRKYNCPVVVLGEQDGMLRGSGRSVPAVNLVELFTASNEFIAQWGGHPGATGLSLNKEDLAPLEQCFNQYLQKKFPEGLPEAILNISATIQGMQISEKLLEDIELLEPFGQENEKPVFVIPNVMLHDFPERFGKQRNHIRFKVGTSSIIGWNLDVHALPLHTPLALAVEFSWNYWQGRRFVQVVLVDWKKSKGTF
ncbi:MAG: single-stranded-DNA-specific exonuclease RecJ [bacterium]